MSAECAVSHLLGVLLAENRAAIGQPFAVAAEGARQTILYRSQARSQRGEPRDKRRAIRRFWPAIAELRSAPRRGSVRAAASAERGVTDRAVCLAIGSRETRSAERAERLGRVG
jgi:hypothetical protein